MVGAVQTAKPTEMRLLTYKGLNLRKAGANFDKVRAAIEADDFKSA